MRILDFESLKVAHNPVKTIAIMFLNFLENCIKSKFIDVEGKLTQALHKVKE